MIFIVGRTGLVEYVNRAAARSIGSTPAAAVGRKLAQLFPPAVAAHQWRSLRRVLATGRPLSVESSSVLKGRTVWLDTRLVPVRARRGPVTSVIGISRDVTRRQQAEQALQESEIKYRGLVEATDTGYVILDRNGLVRDANAEYVRMTGRRRLEQIRGRPVTDWTAAYDRKRNRAEVERCLRHGSVRMLEVDYVHGDGTVVPVEINASVVRTKAGPLVVTLCRDITERKRSERALRESEAKYRALFDQASDGIMFMSADGSQVMVNHSFARMHGYDSPARMARLRLGDLDTPATARLAPSRLRRMLAGESLTFEVDHYHRDGHTFPLQVACSVIRIGGHPFFLGFHRDITERKRAERELRENEEKFYKAFHRSPIVMLITGLTDGRVIDVNDEFVRLFRVRPGQVIGKTTLQLGLWTDRAHRRAKLGPAIERGSVRNLPLDMRTRDGRQLSLLLSSETVAIGGTPCLLTSAFDITETKRMVQQLGQSEERYRLLSENSNDAVWTATLDGAFTYVSPAIRHLQGYSPEEARALGMDGLVAPESRGLLRSLRRELRELLLRGPVPPQATRTATLACRHRSGDRLWCEITTMVQSDGEGRPTGILGVTRDVTQRKQAEDALRASEDQLRTLVENQGEGIGIVDAKERFLFVNPAAEMIFGANPGALVGATIRRFVSRSQYAEVRKQTGLRRCGIRSTYELEIRKQHGQHRRILVTGTPRTDAGGRFIGTFAIFRDITELRRIDQALRQSEEALRKFIDQSAEGIAILDEQGRVAEWNGAQQRIYGIERQRTIGRYFWDLQYQLTPRGQRTRGQRQEFRRLVSQALRTGRSPIFDAPLAVSVTGQDGMVRLTEQRAFPIRTGRGFRIGAVTLDVTEQRRLEQQILEIGDRVQRQVGHDLHDGLSQLLTVMGLRLTALERDKAEGRAVGRGQLSVLSALVKQAMTQAIGLSRGLAPMGLESGGIGPALAELARTTTAVSGIPCRGRIDERIRIGDVTVATHVYRIAQEAVNNAVKHAGASRLEIGLTRDGTTYRLYVSDDGRGIVRRRRRRQGMGLKIMQYRARMIGAALETRPNPAGGTIICCRFNAAADPPVIAKKER
jgi:PAS domain S-box-containing protein